MDSKGILAMLMLLIVPMSGCLGFGDSGDDSAEDEHDHSEHDHNDCPDADGAMSQDEAMDGGEESNSTGLSLALPAVGFEENETGDDKMTTTAMDDCPGQVVDGGNETVNEVANELPIANLTLTKFDGTVMGPNDFILPGDNITFDATGTYDPDGTVDLIGLTVKDTNSTRTVQLFVGGVFVPQTLDFPKAGPINITMRVLDSRGEGIVLYSSAAVNDQRTGSGSATLYDPNSTGCRPSANADSAGFGLVGNQFTVDVTFTVGAGAQWISASATGARYIAICDGDNSKLNGGSGSAATDQGEWAPASDYKLVIYPNTGATANYQITVHYEPKPVE